MKTIPGVADLQVLSALGQPHRQGRRGPGARRPIRPAARRHQRHPWPQAVGGQAAGALYEPGSDRNFPLLVRLSPKGRDSLDAIAALPIATPTTAVGGSGVIQVPLSAVADVSLVSGAAFVYRENQERYIPIEFSVRGPRPGLDRGPQPRPRWPGRSRSPAATTWPGWANWAS